METKVIGATDENRAPLIICVPIQYYKLISTDGKKRKKKVACYPFFSNCICESLVKL